MVILAPENGQRTIPISDPLNPIRILNPISATTSPITAFTQGAGSVLSWAEAWAKRIADQRAAEMAKITSVAPPPVVPPKVVIPPLVLIPRVPLLPPLSPLPLPPSRPGAAAPFAGGGVIMALLAGAALLAGLRGR